MNGYLRAMLTIPNAIIKLSFTKIFHFNGLTFGRMARISSRTEISMDKNAILKIGKMFNMRSGSKIRVRKNANISIGDNVSLSHNCIFACHEKITIGDDVQFSPGVLVYDHDHDFKVEGGVKLGKYKTSPITIGNNVWVGANSIILRGSKIGDNSVIAAGSIVKCEVPPNSVFMQKKEAKIYNILEKC